MSAGVNERRKKQSQVKLISFMLMGAGLILFGAVALVILPKPISTPDAQNELNNNQNAPAQLNIVAPKLDLVDLDGEEVTLEDFLGKVILVNNWATWCPPCREEMPTLEAYYRAHKGQGFVLIGIEAGEPAEEVAEFIDQYNISFPIWLDPQNKAISEFKNMALPSSYVINPKGDIVLGWTGAVTQESLEKYVTPLLKE
jgi:peroxiredoxin